MSEPAGVVVRAETPEDAPAVRSLLLEAFPSSVEADLVDALRSSARPYIALVAASGDRLVGHVAFTAVAFDPMRDVVGLALALAPLAVAPGQQSRGIGATLVQAGLEACREARAGLVVVLGDPSYYARFGFAPASRYGLRCAFDAPEGAFQALELRPFVRAAGTTTVLFRPEFDAFE